VSRRSWPWGSRWYVDEIRAGAPAHRRVTGRTRCRFVNDAGDRSRAGVTPRGSTTRNDRRDEFWTVGRTRSTPNGGFPSRRLGWADGRDRRARTDPDDSTRD
jgi:hypothetical protein